MNKYYFPVKAQLLSIIVETSNLTDGLGDFLFLSIHNATSIQPSGVQRFTRFDTYLISMYSGRASTKPRASCSRCKMGRGLCSEIRKREQDRTVITYGTYTLGEKGKGVWTNVDEGTSTVAGRSGGKRRGLLAQGRR